MRRTVSLSLVALAMAFSLDVLAQQLELVAVLEVEGRSQRVTPQDAQWATDLVRSKAADMLDKRRFKVMTRENMDIIIPPEERRCIEGACYAVVGKKLQAKYVVGGRLTDVGGQIALTLELYESSTGQLLGSELVRANDLNAILDGVGEMAQKLFARITGSGVGEYVVKPGVDDERRVRELQKGWRPETAPLLIKSTPSGSVTLDGKKVSATTPYQTDVNIGRHIVRVTAGEEYEDAQAEVEVGQEGATVELKPKPNFAKLVITTDPSGAECTLSGFSVGKTPLEIPRQKRGSYTVRCKKQGFFDATKEIEVVPEKELSVFLRLEEATGTLIVKTSPPGARLMIGGKYVGVTPNTVRMEAGQYDMVLSLEGYRDYKSKVSIELRQEREVSVTLEPIVGWLKVKATMKGSPVDADVFVDQEKIGKTPIQKQVQVKSHEVTVKYAGQTKTKTVTVQEGAPTEVSFEFGAEIEAQEQYIPKPEEARGLNIPLSLGFSVGFLWYQGTTMRTNATLALDVGMRFKRLRWLVPGLGLGFQVESPWSVTLRPGVRWFIGSFYIRTAGVSALRPIRAWAFLIGFGVEAPFEAPLWKHGFLRLEVDASVWSKALVPVDFGLEIGHEF